MVFKTHSHRQIIIKRKYSNDKIIRRNLFTPKLGYFDFFQNCTQILIKIKPPVDLQTALVKNKTMTTLLALKSVVPSETAPESKWLTCPPSQLSPSVRYRHDANSLAPPFAAPTVLRVSGVNCLTATSDTRIIVPDSQRHLTELSSCSRFVSSQSRWHAEAVSADDRETDLWDTVVLRRAVSEGGGRKVVTRSRTGANKRIMVKGGGWEADEAPAAAYHFSTWFGNLEQRLGKSKNNDTTNLTLHIEFKKKN